jgi:DNA polymerase/3'-5' exonuclease PolX
MARKAGTAGVVEHSISVWCESDIFHALGLRYVPPHMRHFHGISS